MSEIQFSVLDQLDQLEEIVLEGSRIPFSGGRLVNEQDAVEIMDGVRASLPGQVAQADQLLQKKDEFITSARSQADEIVQKAQIQREQLVSAAAVRQEAERQVNEMRDQVRQQCEQLLQSSRQQAAQMEHDMQSKQVQLEQQCAARRQQLEQEALQRRQQLDQEALELKRQLAEHHERSRQQSAQELEQIRIQGVKLQTEAQSEAERIHHDALQFRQQTQQQCESLIQRTRHDAASVQDGANRYAEQTLGELEQRLKEMAQVVLAGRQELVKIQMIRPDSSAPAADTSELEKPSGESSHDEQSTSCRVPSQIDEGHGLRLHKRSSKSGRSLCSVGWHHSRSCSGTAGHRWFGGSQKSSAHL